MRRTAIGFVALAALSGCQDRREALTAPAIPQTAAPPVSMHRVAYLSVSSLTPDAGNTVVVAGNVGLDDSLSVASFVARLSYDPTALHFVGDVSGSDMMRVVNPQDRQITIAAASAQGSSDGRLFKLRFRVDNPAGLSSLMLTVSELNDRRFTNQLATLRLESSLQLDRSLVSGRVIPR